MPGKPFGKSDPFDDVVEKAASVPAFAVAGLIYAVCYSFKYVWRFMVFTGLWPLAAVITVFSITGSMDYLTWPGFFSFVFAPIWTGRNLLRMSGAMVPTSPFRGVFFGIDNSKKPAGKPLTKDGHILVVGGAGTGKSSCIAIPTLRYFWDSSFLAVDIKGELAEQSSRDACIFNPCKVGSFGYDPFYLARKQENPSSQIREIALTLVPERPDVKDPFWIRAAQNILTGYLLYGYGQGQTFTGLLKEMQSYPAEVIIRAASTDDRARMYVGQYAGIKDETLAGIMSELSNHIIPFISDPQIESTLGKASIIMPEQLEVGESIFLQIPEYKINQWKPLFTLIIQQFLTHFEMRTEGSNIPILFLLDEFPRFGKMDGILNGLATLRSKKITICILIQSLAQLDAIYGHDQRKIIADNCGYKAVLGATDAETQQYFSSLVGKEMQEQESFTKNLENPFYHKTVSSSTSMVERAVIRPEEFAYLKDIVLLTPEGFRRVAKQPYYSMGRQTPLK